MPHPEELDKDQPYQNNNADSEQRDAPKSYDESVQDGEIPRKSREHSRSSSSRQSGSSSSSSGRHRSSSSSSSGSSSSSSGKSKIRYATGKSSSSGRRRAADNSLRGRALNINMFFLRVIVSITMLTHGMGKFDMLISHRASQFIDPIGFGPTQSLVLAVFAEVFCSALVLCGLFTSFACIPLIITMLVAILGVHINEGFGRWELPLLYLLIYMTIMVIGPGKYSLDRYIMKLRKQALR